MKKKTIRILAVASAAALLLGGAYLLTRDDIAQKIAENDLTPYMPSVLTQEALGYSKEGLSSENTTVTTAKTSGIEAGFTVETVNTEVTTATQTVLSKDVIEDLKDQAKELQETYPDAIGWIYTRIQRRKNRLFSLGLARFPSLENEHYWQQ